MEDASFDKIAYVKLYAVDFGEDVSQTKKELARFALGHGYVPIISFGVTDYGFPPCSIGGADLEDTKTGRFYGVPELSRISEKLRMCNDRLAMICDEVWIVVKDAETKERKDLEAEARCFRDTGKPVRFIKHPNSLNEAIQEIVMG